MSIDTSNLLTPVGRSFREGAWFEERGELKRALSAYKEAADLAPQAPETLRAVARVYEALGKTRQATEWYMRAEQLQMGAGVAPTAASQEPVAPVDDRWVLGLQPLRIEQQRVSSVAQQLEWFLVTYGPNAMVYRKLGLLLGRLGRFNEAEVFFKRASREELGLG